MNRSKPSMRPRCWIVESSQLENPIDGIPDVFRLHSTALLLAEPNPHSCPAHAGCRTSGSHAVPKAMVQHKALPPVYPRTRLWAPWIGG